jgi:hypothetical protein
MYIPRGAGGGFGPIVSVERLYQSQEATQGGGHEALGFIRIRIRNSFSINGIG